jgi:hypothetical protein
MHVLTDAVRVLCALVVIGIPTAALVAFHRAGLERVRRAAQLEQRVDPTNVRVVPAQRAR